MQHCSIRGFFHKIKTFFHAKKLLLYRIKYRSGVTILLYPHPRPLFHAVELGGDDLVPVVERAGVHENEVVPDGERAPAVVGGVFGIHADPLISGVDVDAAVLRVIILRRVFFNGKQIDVDPLRVEDFSEQAEGGRGDENVILFPGVLPPLLVEEGLGFGEQSGAGNGQDLRIVLPEGKVIFPCLSRGCSGRETASF